jgi:hypothetical protein
MILLSAFALIPTHESSKAIFLSVVVLADGEAGDFVK